MSSLLTFALAGPAANSLPASIAVAPSSTRKAGQWTTGMPGSVCAAVSATVTAVVGRTMSKASRKRHPGSSVLRAFDPSTEVGVMEPLGYWDPLHLMQEGSDPRNPYKSEETFRWYREAELKHGRVSMVAAVGLAAGELYKLPGYEDVPGGMAAMETAKGGAGFAMLFLIAGNFELDFWKPDASKEPGNYGDPFGWTRMPEMENYWVYDKDMRNKELAHCRLAMSGVITSLLLEYGGYDMTVQLTGEAFFPSFVKAVIPALALVAMWRASGTPFYIADDSTSRKPLFVGSGAPAPASLPEAAEAPSAAQAMEK